MKQLMKLRCLAILLIAFNGGNLQGQNAISDQVSKIDSLIFLIPTNITHSDTYSNIQSSGLIHKKTLGVFKKQIGSVSSETVHADTLIFSVSNMYQYDKDSKVLIHDFYFHNNKLIRYNEKLSVVRKSEAGRTLLHEIAAYFDNYNLIYLSDSISDGYVFSQSEQVKVLGMADIEIQTTLETLNSINQGITTPQH